MVTKLDKRIVELEDGVIISKKDDPVKSKNLNTTTQKVDKCETKLFTLESWIVKLEKSRYQSKRGF